jgi:hypothetical protein
LGNIPTIARAMGWPRGSPNRRAAAAFTARIAPSALLQKQGAGSCSITRSAPRNAVRRRALALKDRDTVKAAAENAPPATAQSATDQGSASTVKAANTAVRPQINRIKGCSGTPTPRPPRRKKSPSLITTPSILA